MKPDRPFHFILYLLFTGSILLIGSKCKKEPQKPALQLPPETQTGAGTFGCMVNGKVWLATSYFVDNPAIDNIAIYASRKGYDENGQTINQNIGISVYKSLLKEGKYYLDSKPERWASFSDVIKFCDSDTENDTTNYLVLTRYDLINKIISGRFHFTVTSPSGGCGLRTITEGRFDLKL